MRHKCQLKSCADDADFEFAPQVQNCHKPSSPQNHHRLRHREAFALRLACLRIRKTWRIRVNQTFRQNLFGVVRKDEQIDLTSVLSAIEPLNTNIRVPKFRGSACPDLSRSFGGHTVDQTSKEI